MYVKPRIHAKRQLYDPTQGMEDEIVPCGEAHKIAARIPRARVLKIEGGRHDIVSNSMHWQLVADALVVFLQNDGVASREVPSTVYNDN